LQYEFSERAKEEILGVHGKTFTQIVADKEECIRKGMIPSFPFVCTLKDELRSKEKYQLGKTRIFEQSSLDFVLLCRKYFGHFIDHYKSRAGFTLYHGIQRDVDTNWKLYAEGLRKNSHVGHAFDYKNFDGSVPKECYTLFKMITDWYYRDCCEEDQLARHCLLDNMQNAIHIMGPYTFESAQGNKSGNAFTDVFNSISNTFLIWLTFISWQISVKGKPMNLAEFDEKIKMLTYGDDVVMSIQKPLIEDGYNGKFIQLVLSELGVTITSANKVDVIEDYLPFNELTFLKRPFVYCEEFRTWKGPLPIKDVTKALKYRPKKASNVSGDIEAIINNIQRSMIHHDRTTFEDVKCTLQSGDAAGRYASAYNVSYDALNMELYLKQQSAQALY